MSVKKGEATAEDDVAKAIFEEASLIEKLKSTEPEQVSCETCLKLVPKSEAASAEARDYVAYFCGLECYEEWKREHAPASGE